MADTIVNTTPAQQTDNSAAGWAVALIVILAVIVVGGVLLYRYHGGAVAPSGGTNINVTVPTPSTGSTGVTTGGTTQ